MNWMEKMMNTDHMVSSKDLIVQIMSKLYKKERWKLTFSLKFSNFYEQKEERISFQKEAGIGWAKVLIELMY